VILLFGLPTDLVSPVAAHLDHTGPATVAYCQSDYAAAGRLSKIPLPETV
jgi:hypothetical protein